MIGDRMFERGTDVTPVCAYDEARCTRGKHGVCSEAATCPGFYEGCYRDLKQMRIQERRRATKNTQYWVYA